MFRLFDQTFRRAADSTINYLLNFSGITTSSETSPTFSPLQHNLDKSGFEHEPPSFFIDPIYEEIMSDPVIIFGRYICDRSVIDKWSQDKEYRSHPSFNGNKSKIEPKDEFPFTLLKEKIVEYVGYILAIQDYKKNIKNLEKSIQDIKDDHAPDLLKIKNDLTLESKYMKIKSEQLFPLLQEITNLRCDYEAQLLNYQNFIKDVVYNTPTIKDQLLHLPEEDVKLKEEVHLVNDAQILEEDVKFEEATLIDDDQRKSNDECAAEFMLQCDWIKPELQLLAEAQEQTIQFSEMLQGNISKLFYEQKRNEGTNYMMRVVKQLIKEETRFEPVPPISFSRLSVLNFRSAVRPLNIAKIRFAQVSNEPFESPPQSPLPKLSPR